MIFEHDGIEFNYAIEGTGQDALVIGSPIYYPRTFSDKLKSRLRLIHLSHRGFIKGASTKLPSLEDLLEDIEAFRKSQKLDSFIIIGHSGHAYLALEYAKKYPKHVTKVVLLAAGPGLAQTYRDEADRYFFESEDPKRISKYLEDMQAFKNDVNNDPGNEFIHFCKRSGARSSYDLTFDPAVLWEGMDVETPVVFHMWGKLFSEIDITCGLEHFNRPVFIALGLFDYLVPPFYTWNDFKAKFNNLTFKIFTKSAHHPQLEESEGFDDSLLDWVYGTKASISAR